METNNIIMTINKYYFNTKNKAELAEYKALCKEIKGLGLTTNCFNVIAQDYSPSKYPDNVTIDTDFLFDNQYNTLEGLRVFDWFEKHNLDNKYIKSGYYLSGDIKSLKQAKESQYCCGYCAKRYTESEAKSLDYGCNACINNEYLTADLIHLLQLMPVTINRSKYIPNTKIVNTIKAKFEANTENRLKLIEEARLKRLKAKAIELADKLKESHKAELYELKIMTELLNNGYDTSNLIYYNHSDSWCLGWRNKVTQAELSELNQVCNKIGTDKLTDDKNISLLNKLEVQYL